MQRNQIPPLDDVSEHYFCNKTSPHYFTCILSLIFKYLEGSCRQYSAEEKAF